MTEVRARWARTKLAQRTDLGAHITLEMAEALGRQVSAAATNSGVWQLQLYAGRPVWGRINQAGYWGRGRDYVPLILAISDPVGRAAAIAGWVVARQSESGRVMELLIKTPRRFGCALYWDRTKTRGGPRCMREIAQASLRVLHADEFGYAPAERDVLLTEYARREKRPASTMLARATVDALLAASALYAANQPEAAVELIKLAGDSQCQLEL